MAENIIPLFPAPERLSLNPELVLVALSGEEGLLESTVAQIGRADVSAPQPRLLAADTTGLRQAAKELGLDASFTLPTTMAMENYWLQVLAGCAELERETIFLRAGVKVPDAWFSRLSAAAQRRPEALGLCPLGAVHPMLRAFAQSNSEPGLDVEAVDQWLNDYARGLEFDVPLVLESCALWRPRALEFTADDDAALFREIRRAGDWLLACDHIYVDDAALGELGAAVAGLAEAERRALAEPHPLLTWRHALNELAARSEAPPRQVHCQPVQLNLAHAWGGGLGRWIEDYVAADTHHTNLVLRPLGDWEAFAKTIALYRGADMDVPLRSWTLTTPILGTAISHGEYRQLLAEILRDFRVESLLVSSLIGTSLDVLKLGIPTTLVCHDFFPYCPALVATFDSPCTSCDSARQRQCHQENPHHRFFLHDTDEQWDRVREVYAQCLSQPNIKLVAPTPSVASRYRELVEGAAEKPFNVIPHGLGPGLLQCLEPLRQERFPQHERLKVVVLGSVAPQKGVKILAEIMEPLTAFADLYLIGCGVEGGQFEDRDHVVVIERYTRDELPIHLRNAQVDIGLLLSVVPETFSYTLSEFWAAGIPVVATRLGAFADRVVDDQNGWLADTTPQSVFALLQHLAADRERIALVREKLCNSPIGTTAQMCDAYAELEDQSSPPPLKRLLLGRRSYRNAYRDYDNQRALHINHKATYKEILLEFLLYSRQKAELATTGGKAWQRRLLVKGLDVWIRRLRGS